MDNVNISGALSRLLGDPDTLERITSLASDMESRTKPDDITPEQESEGGLPAPEGEKNENPLGELMRLLPDRAERDRLISLLNAVAPYLSPARRDAAKQLVSILQLLKLTG